MDWVDDYGIRCCICKKEFDIKKYKRKFCGEKCSTYSRTRKYQYNLKNGIEFDPNTIPKKDGIKRPKDYSINWVYFKTNKPEFHEYNTDFAAYVFDGKKIQWADYIDGQWWVTKKNSSGKIIKGVTHWGLKKTIPVPLEDFFGYLERAKKYQHQMQSKKLNIGNEHTCSVCKNEKVACVCM
jgi:hypothetical protein